VWLLGQRFTIAHEIGRLLLHSDEEVQIDEKPPLGRRDELSSQAVDPREIEANQVAALPLMTASLVREFVVNLADDDPDISVEEAIEEIAHPFGVSQLAMTHRLTDLRIISSDDEVAGWGAVRQPMEHSRMMNASAPTSAHTGTSLLLGRDPASMRRRTGSGRALPSRGFRGRTPGCPIRRQGAGVSTRS
jgi:Zn-dependent peptidase ImmA (M78 family)